VARNGMMHVVAMFLSHLAGNELCDEGSIILAEPLGKLTSLEELNLACTSAAFVQN
jgi:hypothetical protein